MKKVIVLAAAAIVTVSLHAQSNDASTKQEIASLNKQESVIKKEKRTERKELRKLEGKEVSYMAKEAFQRDFGKIPVVSWERLDNFDKATFIQDGQKTSAYYDYDTKLVGTTANKTFADLPAKARNCINNKYKDYSIGDVIFFDDNEFSETDMILYNKQFADEDNYFVELQKGDKKIVVQVNMEGAVYYYTQIR
jgi:hypothetical protein